MYIRNRNVAEAVYYLFLFVNLHDFRLSPSLADLRIFWVTLPVAVVITYGLSTSSTGFPVLGTLLPTINLNELGTIK